MPASIDRDLVQGAKVIEDVDGRRRLHIGPATIWRGLIVICILVFWELAPRFGLVDPVFLAPLSACIEGAVTHSSEFYEAILITLGEAVPALLITWVCGGVLGVVLGLSKALHGLLRVASSLYAVPIIILYPLLTAWIGLGSGAKIVFGGLYGLIPMMLTTAAGVMALDQHLILVSRSFGASRLQLALKVVLPLALPSLFAGLRIGGGLALIGVIVGELLGSVGGIGFVINVNTTTFNTDLVYAAVFVALVMAYVLNMVIRFGERLLSPWPKSDSRRVPVS